MQAEQVSACGTGIEREQLLQLEGEAGRLAGLVFASGKVLPRKGRSIKLAIIAAAEGSEAAFAIHYSLQKEDCR